MILKITRQTINNNNVIKTFEPTIVDITQLDLDLIVIPKLKQMCTINNLHYDLIGSNNECKYIIDSFIINDINIFTKKTNQSVEDGINRYNNLVDSVNTDIKRCNKKNNRPINTGVLNNITSDTVKIGAKGIKVTEDGKGGLIIG